MLPILLMLPYVKNNSKFLIDCFIDYFKKGVKIEEC